MATEYAGLPREVVDFIVYSRTKRPNPPKGALGALGRSLSLVANNTLRPGSLGELGISGVMGRYYRLRIKYTFPTLFNAIDRLITEIATILRGLVDPTSTIASLDTDRIVRNHFELAVEALAPYRRDYSKLVEELTQFLAFLLEFYAVQSAQIKRRLPPSLASQTYKSLGAGGYGVVFSPAFPNLGPDVDFVSFPNNTVKLFYKPESLTDAIEQYRRLPDLIGPNAGHRFHTYAHPYMVHDLSRQIFEKIPEANRPTVDGPVSLLRMPNLGVNLQTVQDNTAGEILQLSAVPLTDLLVQIHKLVGQVARLVQRGYVHGDIRSPNIMIDPATGVMTLIDFDFLRPMEEFKTFYVARGMIGFYNNPPEGLLYKKLKTNADLRRTDPETVGPAQIELFVQPVVFNDYVKDSLNDFKAFFNTFRINSESTLRTLLNRANVINAKQFLRNFNVCETKFFQTLDSYSLGVTLINFLTNLMSAGLLTNRGTPYSHEQFNLMAACITEIENELHEMADLELETRKNATEVFSTITTSITTLFTGLGQPVPPELTTFAASVDSGGVVASPEIPTLDPGAAATGAAAAAAASAPRSARRGTRRRLRKQRQRTRRV
jgi:serine/threonine protein kinase